MKTKTEIVRWLKANGQSIGGLTSTDAVALVTSVNLSNLISYAGAPEDLFTAYASIVLQMQEHTRGLAYHAFACELDWGHRRMIWEQAGLHSFIPSNRCTHER